MRCDCGNIIYAHVAKHQIKTPLQLSERRRKSWLDQFFDIIYFVQQSTSFQGDLQQQTDFVRPIHNMDRVKRRKRFTFEWLALSLMATVFPNNFKNLAGVNAKVYCCSIWLSRVHPNSILSLSKATSGSCINHLQNKSQSCCGKINTDDINPLPLKVANPLQPWTGGGNKVETLLSQEEGTHLIISCGE